MGPWAVTIAAVVLIVAARYLLLSGLFAALARRWRPDVYAPRAPAAAARLDAQVRREIGWSLLAALIYGVPAGIVAQLWAGGHGTRIYADAGLHPWWWIPASVAAYLVIHDAWFYWTHRAMHHWPALFRAAHAVHHDSRPPTAWAAMAFHPWEALSAAWLIPALALVIPIHVGALAAVLAVMSLFGTTNHMGVELVPGRMVDGWIGRHLISASHHDVHHRHYHRNFGLYFRFWDRLCGTDGGLSSAVRRPAARAPSVEQR